MRDALGKSTKRPGLRREAHLAAQKTLEKRIAAIAV
jgi:hypothetical protein